MTREEAKMIAREVYRLMKQDMGKYVSDALAKGNEVYMNTKEAAALLGVSESYVNHNIKTIPHTKVGSVNRFKRSTLVEYMERI